MTAFKANALPVLVGSLPMDDHLSAANLVMEHTPDIPLWVQLPKFRAEGMIEQFLPGLPGLSQKGDKRYIDTQKAEFDQEFLEFFEDYLMLCEPDAELEASRFAFTPETGKGFETFLSQVDAAGRTFAALKGQVTGPITFATAVKDENDRDIFYNEQLRDAAVKRLALNAGYQAREFAKRGAKPIIFLDEPALAGFGTSAYITITKEDVTACIDEVAEPIHRENGLAGVHVCANTEWDMLLNSGIDIISFDAYSYFDRFILYPEQVKAFISRGGILAMGIVPTDKAEVIAKETVDSLKEKLERQISQMVDLGIDRDTLMAQMLITPSCGTGSIDFDSAKRVLELTRDLSSLMRKA